MIEIVDCHGLVKNDPNVVYCGRMSHGWKPSVLQNKFYMADETHRDEVFEKYRLWLWSKIKDKSGVEWDEVVRISGLVKAGKQVKLGCWCFPRRCHCESIRKAIEWCLKG